MHLRILYILPRKIWRSTTRSTKVGLYKKELSLLTKLQISGSKRGHNSVKSLLLDQGFHMDSY